MIFCFFLVILFVSDWRFNGFLFFKIVVVFYWFLLISMGHGVIFAFFFLLAISTPSLFFLCFLKSAFLLRGLAKTGPIGSSLPFQALSELPTCRGGHLVCGWVGVGGEKDMAERRVLDVFGES